MSKGLESWKEVKDYLNYCLYDIKEDCKAICYTSTSGYLQPFIDNVETELKRLEKYDLDLDFAKDLQIYGLKPYKETIKQLKEKEKQDEILRIIKEKRVNIPALIECESVKEYNSGRYVDRHLNHFEFDLIKEWLNG